MIITKDGKFYAKGTGEDLFADVGVVLRGYFDLVREKHGEEEAQKVIFWILKSVDDDLKEDGLSLDLFEDDDDEEEEDYTGREAIIPLEELKKFLNGGDLLF